MTDRIMKMVIARQCFFASCSPTLQQYQTLARELHAYAEKENLPEPA
jgi:hypothetical protein